MDSEFHWKPIKGGKNTGDAWAPPSLVDNVKKATEQKAVGLKKRMNRYSTTIDSYIANKTACFDECFFHFAAYCHLQPSFAHSVVFPAFWELMILTDSENLSLEPCILGSPLEWVVCISML